ncbi:hypothetical protein [Alicyclobacillus sp. SO9]|uniref:hypothetical protein n=1 Tax=Alicyclobacillus sp. SO9 TaxID=2665646 RepID=UPI0018E83370|nr:hypothetical protein [Alicyclobacillus sp. SO9]QQE79702.1 hypothetical protein GI364_04220 [Alicyclobacillus sp. SO9]
MHKTTGVLVGIIGVVGLGTGILGRDRFSMQSISRPWSWRFEMYRRIKKSPMQMYG